MFIHNIGVRRGSSQVLNTAQNTLLERNMQIKSIILGCNFFGGWVVGSIGIDNKHLISSTFFVQGGKKHPSQYHPPHSASSVPQSLYEGEQFACQSPIQAFVWPVSPVWSIVIFFTVIIIITPKSVCKLQDKDTRQRQQEF